MWFLLFFLSDNVIESTWSLKNEGDENLIIQLPLTFRESPSTSITISKQPEKSILKPGEETHFRVQYDFNAIHGDKFLEIECNDPNYKNCGILMGGNITSCMCICNSNNLTQSTGGGCGNLVGTSIGIVLNNAMCPGEGVACNPISISDPCDCANSIITSGVFLFRDTLKVNTIPGAAMTVTANNGGFMDNTNTLITGPIGNADGSGLFTYVFYRPPSTVADIIINGTPFVSPAACPAESTCTAAVPTLSQWSLIILFLIMLVVGIVTIQSKSTVAQEA